MQTMSTPLAGRSAGPFGWSTVSLKRLIAWNEHYAVGDAELDAQHQAIFDLALEAADLWDRRAELQQLRDVTDRLADALTAHFACEERRFAGTRYARSDDHVAEHRALLGELNTLRARLAAMAPGRVKSEPGFLVLSYVLGLTVGHLAHSDLDAPEVQRATEPAD